MKLLIVEDESLLVKQLRKMVAVLEPEAEVVAETDSVEATVDWLGSNGQPDLMLMDVELADGQCFEIFSRLAVESPVIFTTAYDEYALKAFKVNSIDYLLKPLKEAELRAALDKWKALGATRGLPGHQAGIHRLINTLQQWNAPAYRNRFLVRQGRRMVPVGSHDIAYFFARNAISFLVTRSGQQYMVEYTLDLIEGLMDPKLFFRVNRQYILAHDRIVTFHPWFNGKLKLEAGLPDAEALIVSRERAARSREWMGA